MRTPIKLITLLVLFGSLILIRVFENELFYDPYLQFFKSDYLSIDSPRREIFKLTLFTTLRYILNAAISLGILYVFFKDKSIVRFSVYFYTIAYLVLLIPFLYFVFHHQQEDYYMFFNIRRFLSQPIFFFFLIPAFYYQKLKV